MRERERLRKNEEEREREGGMSEGDRCRPTKNVCERERESRRRDAVSLTQVLCLLHHSVPLTPRRTRMHPLGIGLGH